MKQTLKTSVILPASMFFLKADLAHAVEGKALAEWFGNYHFIFVHFPIALIVLACVAELLYSLKKDPRYGFVVNFLLISAAIFVIPTALSGLSLAASGMGAGTQDILGWHQTFGIITLILTFLTLFLKNYQTSRPLYLLSLLLLLISVTVTAYLGGLMAFGEFNILPPV